MGFYGILMILRLQIGCLCFTTGIAIPFFAVKREITLANKIFRFLLITHIISLFLDMASVYTVNNLNTVPYWLNRLIHVLFISSLCILSYLIFMYIRHLVTHDNRRRWFLIYAAPMLLALVADIFAPLYYVKSDVGNYSTGAGAMIVYLIIGSYMAAMFYVIIRHRKKMDDDKRRIIFVAILAQTVVTVTQFFLPFILASSLSSTLIVLAIYLTIENPDRILREMYHREKLSAEEAKKQIEKIAYVDMLTGIMNRRQFLSLAAAQVEREKRKQRGAFIVIFDIDFFKAVNDTHGHLIGDKVLECIAERVNRIIRPYDLFGRYGGEEFIAYLGDIGKEDALFCVERMREIISETPMEFGDVKLAISASFGVAPVSCAQTLEAIINKADEALYKAKNDGRNRVMYGGEA